MKSHVKALFISFTLIRLFIQGLCFTKSDEILSLPGVKADRQKKQVWIEAYATGIGSLDPVEFFLIAENSGHNYEAIAVSRAKPSDVHKALKFIGLKEGNPYNPNAMRFWPKGERVYMTFFFGTNNTGIRAEKLIVDKRKGKPLPETGLVFVGSQLITNKVSGSVDYAADVYSPNSIAANYNEPSTVLDVPRRALQGDMYRHQTANPNYLFTSNAPLRILIEPEYKTNKKRVIDIALSVLLTQQVGEEKPLKNVSFSVSGTGITEISSVPLQNVLALFNKLIDEGHDPFVSLKFSGNLTLKTIKEVCSILTEIEHEKGIRIEPPEKGMLYYKAFLPNNDFKERTKRPSQPPELFLILSNNTVNAALVGIKQIWRDDTLYPDLDITPYVIKNPADFEKKLKELAPDVPVILVFADEKITYAQLMSFLKSEIIKDFPTIYIFTENSPSLPQKSYIPAK